MSAEVRARHPATASSSAARRPAARVEGPGKQAGPVWALCVGQRAWREAAGRRGGEQQAGSRGAAQAAPVCASCAGSSASSWPGAALPLGAAARSRASRWRRGGGAAGSCTRKERPAAARPTRPARPDICRYLRRAAGQQQVANRVAGAGMPDGVETLGGRAKPRSGGVCMPQRSPLQRQPARRLARADVGLAEDGGARRQVHRRLQSGGGAAAGGEA